MADPANRFTLFNCFDRICDETATARMELLEEHLAYVETIMDQIVLAGPLYGDAKDGEDGEGAKVIGSLYIFRTGDADEARATLEADPYYQAGFWEVINAYPLLGAAGSAVGGKAW